MARNLKIKIFGTLLFLFFSVMTFAQDKVVMLNGEERTGKVLAVNDSDIKFVYEGEDLEYNISNSEISKIIFSSGRTQVFNEASAEHAPAPSSAATSGSTPESRRDKIAVLPFELVSNDAGLTTEGMAHRVQSECANQIRAHSVNKTVQDPMQTNAILSQKGLSADQMKAMGPQEMAKILDVQYVVYGMVSITNKGTMTTGSNVSTYKDKEKREYDKDESKRKSEGTEVNSSYSNTMINYDTTVDFKIFDDNGQNIYSQSRNAFGMNLDSFEGTLKYLARRTPFGDKN